jgi:hypothetical protein
MLTPRIKPVGSLLKYRRETPFFAARHGTTILVSLMLRRIVLLIILSSMTAGLYSNELPSSSQIRQLMLSNWEKIEDYEVDIKLSLDIPGFRMPSRKIHYLYKAPDKSKVRVKGFAIIPKQGIQPFFTFLKDS